MESYLIRLSCYPLWCKLYGFLCDKSYEKGRTSAHIISHRSLFFITSPIFVLFEFDSYLDKIRSYLKVACGNWDWNGCATNIKKKVAKWACDMTSCSSHLSLAAALFFFSPFFLPSNDSMARNPEKRES